MNMKRIWSIFLCTFLTLFFCICSNVYSDKIDYESYTGPAYNQIQMSWNNLEVHLKQRYIQIHEIIRSFKNYNNQDNSFVNELNQANLEAEQAVTIIDKIKTNRKISSLLSRLFIEFEKYPKLKSDVNFLRLLEEMAATENRIAKLRMHYNAAVLEYVSIIKKMPESLKTQQKEATFWEMPPSPKVKW